MIIRKAAIEDYDSIMRIMSQVQDMHVEWRPDVYKSNNEMISRESYKAALAGDTYFVAEVDTKVVGVMGLEYRHIETPVHVTRHVKTVLERNTLTWIDFILKKPGISRKKGLRRG